MATHLIIFVVMALLSLASGVIISSEDGNALLAFKANVTHPSGKLDSWNLGAECSSWYLVNCNDAGRVVNISLFEEGLTGTISPQLGELAFLEILSLSTNKIDGEIPAELGKLTNLKILYLFDNQLEGSIPPALRNLKKLTDLSLSTNKLVGEIPVELGKLTNLQYLSLKTNKLAGEIPAELGKLVNLQYLYLDENQLGGTIPATLNNLKNLEELSLSTNKLVGEIPVELGKLKNLQTLYLDENQLSGSIPNALGNLKKLKFLSLANNLLDGKIPATLGKLTNLQSLFLYQNQLEGSIPTALGNLKNLTDLFLLSNTLTGKIPTELRKLKNLQSLALSFNNLVGEIPKELGKLTNLQSLYLNENQLGGSIPAVLGDLTSLTELALYSNKLVGEIPAELGKLENLRDLELHNNKLVGQIPAELGNLTNVHVLTLNKNNLVGPIPIELDNLNSHFYVDLSENYLSGDVPTCFRLTISDLNCLNFKKSCDLTYDQRSEAECMSYCDATQEGGVCGGHGVCLEDAVGIKRCDCKTGYKVGPRGNYTCEKINVVKVDQRDLVALFDFKNGITKDPFNLLTTWRETTDCSKWLAVECNAKGKVVTIDLSNKGLRGTISGSLGTLSNLVILNLQGNQLFGSIPSSLSDFASIQALDLTGNILTGNIYLDFKSMSLATIKLDHNYLSGLPTITNNGENFCPGIGKTFSFKQNCFNLSSLPQCLKESEQKLPQDCNQFCNAYQYEGSCGGRGSCFGSKDGSFTCTCDQGYNNNKHKYTCVFDPPSRGLAATPSIQNPKHLNRNFRYGSANFLRTSDNNINWLVALRWSWKAELAKWPTKDQGKCGACWAFASVAALEAAYAIVYAIKEPPGFSQQQLIDCQGQDSCGGGWQGDALNYVVDHSLEMANAYKYLEKNKSRICNNGQYKSPKYQISMYEEVDSFGWLGLLLAVQQQPVIVSLEASTFEFVNYKGGIFQNEDCYSNGVDHTVLLVGYDLSTFPQHWLIRNSWGPTWGEEGYMRLAIAGGVGICGINVVRGLYPIFKKDSDPCNTVNFGHAILKNDQGPGTVNPCGGGKCVSAGTLYTCKCSAPFVAVINIDKSQSCVPDSPCSYFSTNPCSVGTCVNAPILGAYTCLCPIGYAQGFYASDSKPTCVLGSTNMGIQHYLVPSGVKVTCNIVIGSYNIPKSTFFKQNKAIDCKKAIPSGTSVNVTSTVGASGCSLPYTISGEDTCNSVAKLFGIPSLQAVNSELDCNGIFSGQRVCIVKGVPLPLPLCTKTYVPKQGETCKTVIAKYMKGFSSISAATKAFYALNPGIYCDRIYLGPENTQSTSLVEVCLGSTTLGAINKACKKSSKPIIVKGGENCVQLIHKYFGNKRKNFALANSNFQCRDSALRKGMRLCAPK